MARVLVVGDEPDTLLALRAHLGSAGHRAVLAADGDAALECLATGGIDLVVLDVSGALHDGWRVLAAVRGGGGPIPVVVIGEAGDIARAGAGPPRLEKPCAPDDILRCVEDLLARPPGSVTGAGPPGLGCQPDS